MQNASRYAFAVYHHRSTRNQLLRFDNRPWLVPIYLDQSDNLIVQKSSQIGLTELMICELLSQAYRKKSVMYILPTDTMVNSFTPRRIDALLELSLFYRAGCLQGRKDSDTKHQKTLFGIDCHIVGTNSTGGFYEKPVDILIIDEMDKCDQANLGLAFTRLGSSADEAGKAQKIVRMIGNPSIRGRGINKAYNESDKKIWHVQCTACNERQPLDWFENFVRLNDNGHPEYRDLDFEQGGIYDARAMCRKCQQPIDRLAQGEHVPEYLDRHTSGYKATKLFGDPRDGAIEILFNQHNEALDDQSLLEIFYNQGLGEPFTAAGSQYTEEMLANCVDKDYLMPMTATRTVGGMDVGKRLHLHIEAPGRRKVFVGAVADWEEADRICAIYGATAGVVDGLPEEHKTREWCNSHPGWLACFYSLSHNNPLSVNVDWKKQSVSVKRTATLDAAHRDYIKGIPILPKNWFTLDGGDFVPQMCAATRVEKVDSKGRITYVWQEGSKKDHHQHADNYCRIAGELLSSELAIGDRR